MGQSIYTAAERAAMAKLNTPFADVMPPLPPDRYAALKSDIEQAGLLKSILIDEENNIIDGHHRYRACSDLGIEIRTELCTGIEDKRLRIIALNLHQRELSTADRKRLSAEQKRCALQMLAEGRGVREVARAVGRALSTIQEWRDADGDRSGHQSQPTATTTKAQENTDDKDEKTANMSPDQLKAKTLELSSGGMRNSDIAAALGVHPSTVKRWVDDPESQASTRGWGGGRKKVDDSEVQRLFDSGMSRDEIAEELGVHRTTVCECLKRLGLGRAGKKVKNLLLDHASRADAEASAWSFGADAIAAAASVSSSEQVKELIDALGRLSKAASTLKNRLNKDAGKED